MLYRTVSEQDMQSCATKFADTAKIGDCLALHGNLGAGKSTFARYFIKHLLHDVSEIPSPTFTIMQQYDKDIVHIDCYRLESIDDAINIGMLDIIPYSISLIEWPEIVADLLPHHTQHLHFFTKDDIHYIEHDN